MTPEPGAHVLAPPSDEAAALPEEGTAWSMRRRFWGGVAAGGLCAMIWGGQAVVARRSVLDGLTTADVTVLRFVVAGLVLLPVALRQRPFAVGQLGWRRGLTIAALAGAPYSLVIVGGAAFLPAIHSAVVIFGAIPIAATVLAYRVFGDRPGAGKVACLGLVVVGLFVFGRGTLSAATNPWPGFVLFLVAATMWAGFGTLSKLWGLHAFHATATIAVLSLLSVPVWVILLPMRLRDSNAAAIGLQACYMGLLVGVLSTYLYTRAVALLGSVRASMFVALVPLITSVLSAAFLAEWPTASEIAGMLVVTFGVALSLRR